MAEQSGPRRVHRAGQGERMKKYQIELKRVTYLNLTVEANSKEEAEKLGWREIETDEMYMTGDWDIDIIEVTK
jgi:hypothetical protein